MPQKKTKTFVKKELIEMVSKKTGFSIERTTGLVEGALQVILKAMEEADPEIRIEIRGFGSLEVIRASAKPAARNPKTNEVIYVPPHRKARFKPGKYLSGILKEQK